MKYRLNNRGSSLELPQSHNIKVFILGVVAGLTGAFLTCLFLSGGHTYATKTQKALQSLSEGHKWVILYEDGSFSAETTTNYMYSGCIKGGKCKSD